MFDVVFLTHAVGARSVGFERAAHRSQARAGDATDVRPLCRRVRLQPEGRRRGGCAGLGGGLACRKQFRRCGQWWSVERGFGVGSRGFGVAKRIGVEGGQGTHLAFLDGCCVQQHHHQAWQWSPPPPGTVCRRHAPCSEACHRPELTWYSPLALVVVVRRRVWQV